MSKEEMIQEIANIIKMNIDRLEPDFFDAYAEMAAENILMFGYHKD